MKKYLVLLLLISSTYLSLAQDKDTTKARQHFELSFGQSLLFISSGQQTAIFNSTNVVVPTSAILFLAEFRPQKKLRIPVFVNIATETKQYVINNQIVNERASPTVGAGVQFKVFKFKIDDKSKFEMEMGPLASVLFGKKGDVRVAPIVAGRFKVLRGDNFVMYFGGSYSFGINALGILYGTGTLF